MSAYDNPTIIKDESAMIWAQGIASFGENFAKARAARQEMDLKEKAYEDKLKAETKKTAIAIQSANIEQGLANQKEIGAVSDQMEKTKIDTVFQDQWKSDYAGMNEKKGDFNVLAKFTELNKDQMAEGIKYAEAVTQWKDKSLSGLAANQTNVNEWAALSPRERANTAFMGNTPLERKISEITLYSSNPANYNWKGKVDKKLYKENDNPANPGIEIITKVDLAKDLKGFTEEELQAEAKKPNGAVIYNETDKQYSVRFKQKLGDPSWDGTFYHKVAEAPDSEKIWGKDQANILDPKTNTSEETDFGLNLTASEKWMGAVLGRNGKIYAIPYDSNDILIIDPTTDTATLDDFGLNLNSSNTVSYTHLTLPTNREV